MVASGVDSLFVGSVSMVASGVDCLFVDSHQLVHQGKTAHSCG